VDPNTLQQVVYAGNFVNCSNLAVYNDAVRQKFKSIQDSELPNEDKANQITTLSVATGVLSQHTAMIAYERMVKTLTEPAEFVKVPMHLANNKKM
jgi:hypothetical protein